MLSQKQKKLKFAREYVKNGHNGAAAYRAIAGSKITNGSAKNGASRMLRDDDVMMTIKQLEQKVITKESERIAEEAQTNAAKADDAVVDVRAELIAFYRSMMKGEICDSTTTWDDKARKWVEVKRVAKASDRANAAEKLAAFYGITAQPSEDIQIELIGGIEELSD